MRISGFTLIRNGLSFEYPFLESLASLTPLCDEIIVNVGKGDDTTIDKVLEFSRTSIQCKILVFENDWDLDKNEKKRNGSILSEQTNFALDRCSGDWCLYLQADEVLHEGDYLKLRNALNRAENLDNVSGLVFDYVHFYGSYNVIHQSRSAYKREIRCVRKDPRICSIGDAQSFRFCDGGKLPVISSGARIFHYGWVRSPSAMREKTYFMDQLYHDSSTLSPEQIKSHIPHTGKNYVYKKFWGLKNYEGDHPRVMQSRIDMQNWHWNFEDSPWVWKWSDLIKIFLDLIERASGYRLFEYKCFRLLK